MCLLGFSLQFHTHVAVILKWQNFFQLLSIGGYSWSYRTMITPQSICNVSTQSRVTLGSFPLLQENLGKKFVLFCCYLYWRLLILLGQSVAERFGTICSWEILSQIIMFSTPGSQMTLGWKVLWRDCCFINPLWNYVLQIHSN
jgi:hypothetical protein